MKVWLIYTLISGYLARKFRFDKIVKPALQKVRNHGRGKVATMQMPAYMGCAIMSD